MTLDFYGYLRRRLGNAIQRRVALEVGREREVIVALQSNIKAISVEHGDRIRALELAVAKLQRESGQEST